MCCCANFVPAGRMLRRSSVGSPSGRARRRSSWDEPFPADRPAIPGPYRTGLAGPRSLLDAVQLVILHVFEDLGEPLRGAITEQGADLREIGYPAQHVLEA